MKNKKPMSKLHIAALCSALGLGVDQVPALKELRLTDDVEFTPIPEEIKTKISAETIAAAQAKRARQAAKKAKK